jgi:hypothetical protein
VAYEKACQGVLVVQIAKSDGSPCYSFESYTDNGTFCEVSRYTWKDPSGQVVASGWGSQNGAEITCMTGSTAKTCTNPSAGPWNACCDVTEFGAAACPSAVRLGSCSAGSCP